MKALSVKQPWAWAIFHGKDVENRDWPTNVRGPVRRSETFLNIGIALGDEETRSRVRDLAVTA